MWKPRRREGKSRLMLTFGSQKLQSVQVIWETISLFLLLLKQEQSCCWLSSHMEKLLSMVLRDKQRARVHDVGLRDTFLPGLTWANHLTSQFPHLESEDDNICIVSIWQRLM